MINFKNYINLKLLILISLFVAMASCEVDDICVEKVLTPKLILRFYDTNDHTKTKNIQHLSVWVTGKDTLYKDVKTDSIAIPLDVSATQTVYQLKSGNDIDVLHINHENNIIFVSRSCGYKYNFILQDLPTLTNSWISGFEHIDTPKLIENEDNAHLKIYH